MTDFEKYSLIISVVGLATTIIIIIIAIWGEKIRQIWSSPKLYIKLFEPTFNRTVEGIDGWYYLIQVINDRKSAPANNVRLLLNKVYKKAPDDSWQELKFSGPTQVMWQWPNHMPLYATIGPPELSTFGALLSDSDKMELKMYWYPNNLKRSILPNDPTRLEFQAVSDTAISKPIIVEIAWDGNWETGRSEMQNHCIVKEISV